MNIHATCISFKRKGVLIIGKSGSGKSDLALRMIMQKGAKLVSDDRTDVSTKKIASPPKTIEGLLEIRGLGIRKFPFVKQQKIHLVIELAQSIKEVERMPEAEFYEINGAKFPKIKLYSFEQSVLDKIEAALSFSVVI
jgi:serine kinase of HPr protein (carbohydrate metabolism regulator)